MDEYKAKLLAQNPHADLRHMPKPRPEDLDPTLKLRPAPPPRTVTTKVPVASLDHPLENDEVIQHHKDRVEYYRAKRAETLQKYKDKYAELPTDPASVHANDPEAKQLEQEIKSLDKKIESHEKKTRQ
jgi:hypothetical protein